MSLKVTKLRCEYKENPIGIDILKPRLSWIISSDKKHTLQSNYQIQVSKEDGSFNKIVWDSGKVASDNSIGVEYEGEDPLSSARYFYRVRVWEQSNSVSDWSAVSYWEMGLLSEKEWIAEWITSSKDDSNKSETCPLFRKPFNLGKPLKRARIYATSLGLYELHLNGEKVSDRLFTPGWTNYNKWLQYQTYDVTEQLKEGTNVIGAILGEGWYKGDLAWEGHKSIYGDKIAVLIQLHIYYLDGTQEIISSDATWKTSDSPILMSSIYHGEIYDAKLEKHGWDLESYDDNDWSHAKKYITYKNLISQINVPVRKVDKIIPLTIFKTPMGETVIDFGQNMVGWVKFMVKGNKGDRVILQHAEVLDKDGNFYIANLRSAKQTIEYRLKGNDIETYEPHFTFQGFRYIKLVEYPGEVLISNFTGMVISSDMEQTGSFKCSNAMINQLQHNILWGQKGNFLDLPTDCPQRDERLGWTGDAQVFIRTASYIMNTASFFTKWLKDLKSEQLENGGIPHVIPNVLGKNDNSSAAWADASVICPWTIYLCYGDKRILKEQYDSMKAWIEYVRGQGNNEFLWNTGFHFGDWLGLDAKENSYIGATSVDFIATAFFAYSTSILLKTAKILDKSEDITKYETLYNNIEDAFKQEFITANGRLAVPTQTAHILALMFNLVEEKHRKRTIDTLVEYLKENKYHLTTGFVGTPYLCHVLSENGYTDVAYMLLLQTDYPSWLYPISKGATTIWEHWDGIKPNGTFWSDNMNSYNHYAYGAIGDWLYRVVAGINIDEENPGYKHIILKPQPGGNLDFVNSEIDSIYGKIKSEWKLTENKVKINITIPANTTATLELPFASLEKLNRNGELIEEKEGILKVDSINETVRIEVGSGDYSFEYDK